MTDKEEFKKKYFSNNFYWVTFSNHIMLQYIAIEVGCLLHTGEPEMIKWHKEFSNLGFRTTQGISYMQKEAFLTHSENPTNYSKMLEEYELLFSD